MDGREIRMKRLLGDGRAVIIAMDHGMFAGPIPGMEDLPATAAKINPAVDGVLLSPGMLPRCASIFAGQRRPLAVVRLNWSTAFCPGWGYRQAHTAQCYTAEDALRNGMDVALASLTLQTGSEQRDTENARILSKLAAEAHRLGIAMICEYVPAAHQQMTPQQLHENVRSGSRIAVELGADAIKTFYTPEFPALTASCPVPVLALGGQKLPKPADALGLAAAAVAAGAAGVVFGRNALQVADPYAFQAALCEVVKNRAQIDQTVARFGLA
ncbi:MAG: class I fructose-bisphosphate aldolase [Phycisphaerae bacterium]